MTLPVDKPMKTEKYYEFSDYAKERPFEASPRRHFEQKFEALYERLIKELIDDGAIEKRTEKDMNGLYKLTIKLWTRVG